MRKVILAIFFSFLTIITFGQVGSKINLKYKPQNLDEAVLQLDKILHDTIKQQIYIMTEDQFIGNSHFGMGMWIRNNWRLWKGGQLSKSFNSLGIHHPDDMSGIILTSYYRHLKGQERKLNEQVKYYQDYWKTSTEHFNRLKTDTAYQKQIRQRQDSLMEVSLNEKKIKWSTGKVVSGYLGYQCGFLGSGKSTEVRGTILEWKDNKLIIKITQYLDERKKKKVIECNNIINNIASITNHENFKLEE